jgi:hypothetical protein
MIVGNTIRNTTLKTPYICLKYAIINTYIIFMSKKIAILELIAIRFSFVFNVFKPRKQGYSFALLL